MGLVLVDFWAAEFSVGEFEDVGHNVVAVPRATGLGLCRRKSEQCSQRENSGDFAKGGMMGGALFYNEGVNLLEIKGKRDSFATIFFSVRA
jgi:hypothetical protein